MADIKLNSIEDAVKDFQEGKFVIVVDDEDRENEGDLIFAAETMTQAQMALMIRACFGEDDAQRRRGACHDEYNFGGTLVIAPDNDRADDLPQLLCHEHHVVHHVLGLARKACAQGAVLGGDARGAGVLLAVPLLSLLHL